MKISFRFCVAYFALHLSILFRCIHFLFYPVLFDVMILFKNRASVPSKFSVFNSIISLLMCISIVISTLILYLFLDLRIVFLQLVRL